MRTEHFCFIPSVKTAWTTTAILRCKKISRVQIFTGKTIMLSIGSGRSLRRKTKFRLTTKNFLPNQTDDDAQKLFSTAHRVVSRRTQDRRLRARRAVDGAGRLLPAVAERIHHPARRASGVDGRAEFFPISFYRPVGGNRRSHRRRVW